MLAARADPAALGVVARDLPLERGQVPRGIEDGAGRAKAAREVGAAQDEVGRGELVARQVGDFEQHVPVDEFAGFLRRVGVGQDDHDIEVGVGGEGGVGGEPVGRAVVEGPGEAWEAAGLVRYPLARDSFGVFDEHGAPAG